MRFEFDSEIKQLEGKIRWSVFYFPYSAFEMFGSKGNIPVCITVDGHAFDHTLLPSKNGHYLVYNEFIRQAVGKDMGNIVHVTLEKDVKKREFVTPAHYQAALQNAHVWDVFCRQPNYLRREQINAIEIAKQDETKTRRFNALIQKLAETEQPQS